MKKKSKKLKKVKNKASFKSILKRNTGVIFSLIFILVQTQILSAFESRVINVTARIINDIPVLDPPGGEFCSYETVTATLSVSLPGATIWYTQNGTEPICDSNGEYYGGGEITIPAGISFLKARSCHDGKQSVVASWRFDVSSIYCQCLCEPGQELVINGGFESPVVDTSQKWDIFTSSEVPGWNVEWVSTEPSVYNSTPRPLDAYLELHKGVNGWLPHSGDQYAELDTDWDGPGGSLSEEPASVKISQGIPTIPGQPYVVKFYFSPRPSTNASNNKLEFRIDGEFEDNISGTGGSNTDWSEHIYMFIADQPTTTIEFADLGTSDSLGTFLDDVSVQCFSAFMSSTNDNGPEILEEPEVDIDVVLNEFLPNPSGLVPDYGFDFGEDGDLGPQGEWVELYNKGEDSADVSGWYIKDSEDNIINISDSNTDTGSTVIPAQGWLVVYMNQEVFDNDGDTIRLYDASDTQIDSYTYDNSGSCALEPTPSETNDETASSTECSLEVPGNKSYARIPDGSDSWEDPIPTPGSMNKLEKIITIVDEEQIEDSSEQEDVPEYTGESAGTTTDEILEQEIVSNDENEATSTAGEAADEMDSEEPDENGTSTDEVLTDGEPVDEPSEDEPVINESSDDSTDEQATTTDELSDESDATDGSAEELPADEPVDTPNDDQPLEEPADEEDGDNQTDNTETTSEPSSDDESPEE